jgi:hypothetical protein
LAPTNLTQDAAELHETNRLARREVADHEQDAHRIQLSPIQPPLSWIVVDPIWDAMR